MLYQLYETQRALMAPFADFASATARLYSHPLSPFKLVPGAVRLSAGFDLIHRLGKSRSRSTCPSAPSCASSASPTSPRPCRR